mmetsp:Transcript_16604/g.47977  ORF Transcript_16604/g.47977 Transcript_16604/m.47977 type:complete len:265 (+) Transcript_16604:2372-3166(+)
MHRGANTVLSSVDMHLFGKHPPRPEVEFAEAAKTLLDDGEQRLAVLWLGASRLRRVKRGEGRGDVGEGRTGRRVGRRGARRVEGDRARGLSRGRLGEGQHGDALERRAHLEKGEELHDAPEPAAVRWARKDEQPVAARQEDGQARERLLHVSLVDAELVEPDGGRPAVLSLEGLGPRAQCGPLWLGRVLPAVRDEGVALAHGPRLAAPIVRAALSAVLAAAVAVAREEAAAAARCTRRVLARARVAVGDKVRPRQQVEGDGPKV